MRGLWGDRTRRRSRAWLITMGFILSGGVALWNGPARAADPVKRFSLAGQGGFAYYQMGEVNAGIKDGNRYLAAPARSWKEMGSLHLGFNFAADFHARLTKSLGVSVGAGSTFGQSSVNFQHVIKVAPKSSFYHFRATYLLPFRPMASTMLSVGVGPVYFPSAKLKVTDVEMTPDGTTVDRSVKADFEGKGWGVHAFLQGETVLSDKATLVMDLGYRRARIARDPKKDRWGIGDIQTPFIKDSVNGVQNQYNLNPGGDDSFMTSSFLVVTPEAGQTDARVHPYAPGGIPVTRGRDGLDFDFSGVVFNVGLRFYLF